MTIMTIMKNPVAKDTTGKGRNEREREGEEKPTSVFQKTYPVRVGTKQAYMKPMKAVRGVQRK